MRIRSLWRTHQLLPWPEGGGFALASSRTHGEQTDKRQAREADGQEAPTDTSSARPGCLAGVALSVLGCWLALGLGSSLFSEVPGPFYSVAGLPFGYAPT